VSWWAWLLLAIALVVIVFRPSVSAHRDGMGRLWIELEFWIPRF
jgi:hypothetical protein